MYKEVILGCLLWTFQVAGKAVQPRDVFDEAKKQFDQLNSLVEGVILEAETDLNNFGIDFAAYSKNVLEKGRLTIDNEEEAITTQLRTLSNLAFRAGKDVTTCVDAYEVLLFSYPVQYKQALEDCVEKLTTESTKFLVDNLYLVDVNVNNVLALQDQLDRCGDSLTCIELIITTIQLNMVQVPANIKAQISEVKSQLSSVKLLVDQCSKTEIPAYVSVATKVLSDATRCIDRTIAWS